MGDFATEILKKYGTPAVIFAFVLACIIWFFAHIAAAPGGEVSILWGLAKYTKKSEPTVTPEYTKKSESTVTSEYTKPEDKFTVQEASRTESAKAKIHPDPVSLTVIHNTTEENISLTLSKLREERKLRELSVSESGKK